ncbi:hypothetical protein BF49_4740 [Bradyrhizobium sp.]|uniref:hypothetical protein n=1 Tax=Bradyrhizobium sp. TaxID=376 RepID=UPI0007C18BC2|nr:hypothetical protein [Bradyrhizobium sp.]CUT13660.1 hypothetical protein BF49_4740 [Bradyrhizobium sp.]
MFPPQIYELYKQLRGKISQLAREDSLRVIWAYTQYLQVPDFKIPSEIAVDRRFYERDVKRAWINEWLLMLLAKEVILHCGPVAKAGVSLRVWNTLAAIVDRINKLEAEIYRKFGSPDNVLVELIRIAHRTFEWQGNGPTARAIIRYHKILNTPEISLICEQKFGVTVYEVMACGTAMLGHFLESHVLRLPLTSQIAELPMEKFKAVLALIADDVASLKTKLKDEQKYNESFAYAYNSLRTRPIVFMCSGTSDVAICPIPTLLFWRFTSGLYYDFINIAAFANLFGESYQAYVGEAIRAAAPKLTILEEQIYTIGTREKRSVDWIVSDTQGSALFLECKVKRLRWDTKQTLSDTSALEQDISYMASAVVQTYRTIQDCLAGRYPHFAAKDTVKIYPCIITLENWHMHGPVMYGLFREQVKARMKLEGLPEEFLTEMPYSIWPIDDFELGLQIMNESSVAAVMNGKLLDNEHRDWEWRPYLSKCFKEPRKELFEDDYRRLFSDFNPA